MFYILLDVLTGKRDTNTENIHRVQQCPPIFSAVLVPEVFCFFFHWHCMDKANYCSHDMNHNITNFDLKQKVYGNWTKRQRYKVLSFSEFHEALHTK